MGGIAAVWGGFSSFFSVWQLCIMQFSPFFIAFIVGIYLVTTHKTPDPKLFQWITIPCITYSIGFAIIYSLLIASGLDISRPLIHNIGFLRVLSGFIILLVSLYILLSNRISFLSNLHSPLLISMLSLLLGITFAIIYSPCITPMLSDIMGLGSQRDTAAEGWLLALCYGLGTSIALGLTSIAAIRFAGKREMVLRNTHTIRIACGSLLLILAIMNMTGLMRHYKALVLGLVL